MKILITGIHGFVGSNLTRALKQQHTLYGLDVVAPETEGVVRTFGWDDLGRGTLPGVDVIIHLAGKAHDTRNESAAEAYFAVNTELTKRIYDYFLASGAQKFLFFSTVKAAADRVNGEALTESVAPAPKGPYGESKQQAEAYIQQHQPAAGSGKSVYLFRPCMIHGPGNKGNLNLLYRVIQKGIPWPLAAFENRRSFASIGNVSYIMEAFIERPIPSGVYNISDDEALSTNELIALMGETLGRKTRLLRLPAGLVTTIASVGSRLHLPLNSERLEKLTETYVVSNAKVKAALGIPQLPVTAREGLRETLRSFEG